MTSHDRGQMIMACGTGKTLTALFINEKLAAQRTLVLVPSLSLLAQTLREWTANTKAGFDFLPVCSDETVAEPDAVVANTSDLGFPVTTDPEEIADVSAPPVRPARGVRHLPVLAADRHGVPVGSGARLRPGHRR